MLTHWNVILYLCLFCTKWLHCSSQKIGHKRVMLFTNNDNPHADNTSLQVRIPFTIYLLEFKKGKINMVLIKFSIEGSTLLDAAKNYYYYYFFNDGIITTHFLYLNNRINIFWFQLNLGLAWPVTSYNHLENGELHVTFFFLLPETSKDQV